MEQHSFENKIKEQLRNREIAPSAASWDKLNAKLEANNHRKSDKFWWLGIAAAVAVGIFIGTSFFTTTSTKEQIVDAPTHENLTEEAFEVENTAVASEEIVLEEEPVPSKQGFIKSKNSVIVPNVTKKSVEKENSAIAQNTQRHELVEKIAAPSIEQPLVLENKSIAEIFPKKNNIDEDRLEAEDLLAKARRKILSEASANSQESVASHELLKEVEADLDESFRNQVFDVLKEGFTKVRVAVADRNK